VAKLNIAQNVSRNTTLTCKSMKMDIDDDNPIYKKFLEIEKRVNKMGEITRKLMLLTQYKTKDYLKRKTIDIDKASE